MSKRIKAQADIATRAEFELVLDETATLQLVREKLVLKRDRLLLEVREKHDVKIKEIDQQLSANVLRCEKFATIHRDTLFGKLKSAASALTHYGFRTGNPTLKLLNKKWSWETVLLAIKTKGWLHLVITKEAPDKDAIKLQLDDTQRAEIGTRIEQEETFYIEPKRDAAVDQRMSSAKEAA